MYVGGARDNRSRLLRRVLMRRCLLMLVLLFRHISEAVLERFPTIDHLVQFGEVFHKSCRQQQQQQERKTRANKLLSRMNWVKRERSMLSARWLSNICFVAIFAGVMSQSEKKHYESIQADISLFWVPGAWYVMTYLLFNSHKATVLSILLLICCSFPHLQVCLGIARCCGWRACQRLGRN